MCCFVGLIFSLCTEGKGRFCFSPLLHPSLHLFSTTLRNTIYIYTHTHTHIYRYIYRDLYQYINQRMYMCATYTPEIQYICIYVCIFIRYVYICIFIPLTPPRCEYRFHQLQPQNTIYAYICICIYIHMYV